MNMAIEEKNVKDFTDKAKEAADLISETVSNDGLVHVISHLDSDGLAAAGIITKALWKLNARFRCRVQQWADDKIVADITSDNPTLTILTDLGSGYLDILSEHLTNHRILILDHHQPAGEATPNILQVNPHFFGIDGSKDVSGAGVTYFVARTLDETNRNLACIAIVGALGDLQDKYKQRSLGGLNKIIVQDAIDTGYLKTEKDLMFFGRETRPIHKALAYTTSPFIPGISGEEDYSYAFLRNLEIPVKEGDRWRVLRDLSEDEKQKLCSALSDHLVSKGYANNVLSLIGTVYVLIKEKQWTCLRDAREFSVLLNGTGRLGKAGLGVSICVGDRSEALELAEEALQEYRRTITEYLSWLYEDPNRIEELDNIYVIHGGDFINEKMIGTLSTILSTNLSRTSEKPIIAYATVDEEDIAKISARTLETLTSKGLDLGEVMREAAEKLEGKGGGHNIAAGAQVPTKEVNNFIKLVDQMIKKKMGQIATES